MYKTKDQNNSQDKSDNKRRITETQNKTANSQQNAITVFNGAKMVDPDVHRLKVETPNLLRVDGKIYLRKFDLTSLSTEKDGKRVAIIGRSGSGKSLLTLEILRALGEKIPVWMVFNPSEPGNNMYSPYVENVCVREDFDNDILEKFKQRQIKKCKQWRIPESIPTQYYEDPSAGLIFDDMFEDTKIFKLPIFEWLFYNSRNFKTLFIILLQYAVLLPPKFRRNFSHVFVYSMGSLSAMKQAHSEFFTAFDKFEEFKSALELCTNNYGTMVADMLSPSLKLEDRVFWYRHSKFQPAFKAGAKKYNTLFNKALNKDWDKESSPAENTVVEPPKVSKKANPKAPMEIELVE